ncbi:proteasome assembly chaperone 1 [Cavenderia fasciculata]|uniref:Proteasome assembly chaperone 1 n=1 Tax=Cavenderia fasciculata TaxID=261658 RepID=F4PR96_CACFS|nr:proteasome assembly chaperone 1 [Cavenderia fasciculata]EGG21296.1 proteasome assembly chaperone 1 [Cavenderia fasciculata]|eukprot:XP_004359146.1 proteasome assembly chaperone 1 [Cavenderia fasciculata]
MNAFDIQPVRSRNWEVEEEEEETRQELQISQPYLKFNNESWKSVDLSNRVVIVSTSDAPSIFIRSTFTDLIEIGEIIIDDIKPIKSNEIIINNRCILYQSSSDKSVVFVICQYKVESDRAFNMTETIFGLFKTPQSVIVLDSLINTLYLSTDYRHPSPPFLRVVYTSSFQNVAQLGFIPLESPNLVERLTAGILSYIPAISLQNLVESSELSVASIANFEGAVAKLHPVFQSVQESSKNKERLALYRKMRDRRLEVRDRVIYLYLYLYINQPSPYIAVILINQSTTTGGQQLASLFN